MTAFPSPNCWDTVIGTTENSELSSIRRKMSEQVIFYHCEDPDMDNLTKISDICFKKKRRWILNR